MVPGFSPEEFASQMKEKEAHHFPYFRHLSQFWGSYLNIINRTKQDEKINFEYHVMIMVIGLSTSVEYFFKGLYEITFGALSYIISGRVTEDDFTAEYAREYVDFIKHTPWYEFEYKRQQEKLVDYRFGMKFRSFERRFILHLELAVKNVYAKLIKKATKSSFEAPKLTTVVLIDKELPSSLGFKKLEKISPYFLYELPRYDPFSPAALKLAESGANFKEIAGNQSVILVSLITKDLNFPYPVLIKQKILTKPGFFRVGLEVPVKDLSSFLLKRQKEVEHVFDY